MPDSDVQTVRAAVTSVINGNDIFSAALRNEDGNWLWEPGGRAVPECTIQPSLPREILEQEMAVQEQQPMDFPDTLCIPEVIPLEEGGTMLFVRFHHIILDGFGMSLFAQQVLDALAGKEVGAPSFFDDLEVSHRIQAGVHCRLNGKAYRTQHRCRSNSGVCPGGSICQLSCRCDRKT
ncbi:MAG: hypothetical protein GX685_08150 [Clostridiales bacterium]|nr:hypothetical protein [Clostridiales bacterium]